MHTIYNEGNEKHGFGVNIGFRVSHGVRLAHRLPLIHQLLLYHNFSTIFTKFQDIPDKYRKYYQISKLNKNRTTSFDAYHKHNVVNKYSSLLLQYTFLHA